MRFAPFAAFALWSAVAHAQVPGTLAYQGRLLKADGAPEVGVVSLTFGIYDAVGTKLWEETQLVGLSDGYYSVRLGATTGCDAGVCSGIPPGVFDGNERFLQLAVGNAVLSPRQPVGSVAYAYRAFNQAGGTVNATSISVGGVQVFDNSGRLSVNALPDAGDGIVIANNTISVAFGSTSTTAVRGDDPRLDAGVTVVPELPGVNCSDGGVKIVASNGTAYVCHGYNGVAVTAVNEDAGVNCVAGGVKFTSSTGVNYACNAPDTRPYVEAYRQAAMSLTCNTPTKVTFDAETEDVNALYSTSTGRLTLTAGLWQMTANLQSYSSAESNQLVYWALYKNGSDFKHGSGERQGTFGAGALFTTTLRVAAGDFFEFYLNYSNCTVAASVTALGPSNLWMQAVKLGN